MALSAAAKPSTRLTSVATSERGEATDSQLTVSCPRVRSPEVDGQAAGRTLRVITRDAQYTDAADSARDHLAAAHDITGDRSRPTEEAGVDRERSWTPKAFLPAQFRVLPPVWV